MFTGIVEELGIVKSVKKGPQSSVIIVEAKKVLEGTKIGDSIAVNGVCLTVKQMDQTTFQADVMNETFSRSNLESLANGSGVNLERAMIANGRFGGHIVAGHVDDTGVITAIQRDANAIWFTVSASKDVMRYCIEKGSITMDGISLTIAKIGDVWFQVSVIPHTMEHTNLGKKKIGDKINLENDMVGKYIEKFLKEPEAANENQSNITKEMLLKAGF